jgi:hypothetical protein
LNLGKQDNLPVGKGRGGIDEVETILLLCRVRILLGLHVVRLPSHLRLGHGIGRSHTAVARRSLVRPSLRLRDTARLVRTAHGTHHRRIAGVSHSSCLDIGGFVGRIRGVGLIIERLDGGVATGAGSGGIVLRQRLIIVIEAGILLNRGSKLLQIGLCGVHRAGDVPVWSPRRAAGRCTVQAALAVSTD